MMKSSKFYLNKSLLLEESSNPAIFKLLILSIAVIVSAFVFWSTFFQIEEIAKCTGAIETLQKIQKVQHPYGGLVEDIKIREGQRVQKDDVLLILDGDDIRNKTISAKNNIDTLLVRRERINAFVDNKQPNYTALQVPEKIIIDQNKLLDSFVQALTVNKQLFSHQIKQLTLETNELNKKLTKLKEQLKLTREELLMYKELSSVGASSKIEIIKIQKSVAKLSEEADPIPDQILLKQAKISEAEENIKKLDIDAIKNARLELEKINKELPLLSQEFKHYQRQVSLLTIKSPCNGVIHKLTLNTKGGVIIPGAVLVEVVPSIQELRGIVNINPKDVGHLKAGQKVTIKLTTYDFGRYGAITGKLLSISPTSVTHELGGGYYKGEIALDSTHLITSKGNLPLFAGLSFQGEIHTGSKSLFEYLLRPIFVSAQGAMHER